MVGARSRHTQQEEARSTGVGEKRVGGMGKTQMPRGEEALLTHVEIFRGGGKRREGYTYRYYLYL